MQSQGFDYIVIGAGSAGGLLTYRLPQIPDLRISLLEAGNGVEIIGIFNVPNMICDCGGPDRRRPGIENHVLGTT